LFATRIRLSWLFQRVRIHPLDVAAVVRVESVEHDVVVYAETVALAETVDVLLMGPEPGGHRLLLSEIAMISVRRADFRRLSRASGLGEENFGPLRAESPVPIPYADKNTTRAPAPPRKTPRFWRTSVLKR